MKKICVFGSGGHAASCIDLIESTKEYEIIGIISENKKELGKKFLKKYKIIGTDKDYQKILKKCDNIVIGVSFYKKLILRNKIFKELKNVGFKMPIICSPKSHISLGVTLGEGTQIFHGVTINKNVNIGNNCIINSHSLVEHDVAIYENCQISTGVILNGGCKIKENSFIGSGSILRENIVIKKNSFIRLGSVIKK